MVVWKQNSDFVLRWINFHQQACLAQQAQTEIKHYKRLGFSIPEKQVWMHSWPFPTSSQLPPPRASNFTKHKSRGSTCQSLAGDHKVVSENKHQMSFCCPFTRFSPGGKVSVLEDVLHSSWPLVCGPFTDGESYTSCFALWSHYIWAGSSIIPIPPLFKFWFSVLLRAGGIQREVLSPHLWPASASVTWSSYQHANLPFPLTVLGKPHHTVLLQMWNGMVTFV